MKQTKYEDLLERSVRTQESLDNNFKLMSESMRQFNDKFPAHVQETHELKKEIWSFAKWAVIVLIAILSILTGLKQFGILSFILP